MATSRYNIEAIAGSTLLLNINCTDSNGNYLDFTNYSVSGFVRYNYSSTGVLLNLNPTIGSAISGLINISGNSNDLSNLAAGVYVYDIEAHSAGYTFKPLRGYFSIENEVTH